MNNSIKCPLSLSGRCKYELDLVPSSLKKPVVFYAFDSLDEENEHYYKQNLIKEKLESKIKSLGFEFKCFDNTTSNGLEWFCTKICFEIQNSSLVIADVSCYDKMATKYTVNPNVAFELGIAFGFKTKFLLISSTEVDKLPADFKNLEIIKFKEDFDNGKLDKYLKNYLNLNYTSAGFEIVAGTETWGNKILQAESFDADWLLAAEYHSTLFKSMEHINKFLEHRRVNYQQSNSNIVSRWRKFRVVLERNDKNRYYHIFELKGVKQYFSTGYSRLNNTKESIKVEPESLLLEIDQTIELLKKHYPRLMIAFYEGKLPYGFFVRPDNCVIIDSQSEFPDSLNGIVSTLKGIVDEMTRVFWVHWNEIPNEHKQLDYVINQYENFKTIIN